MRKRNKQMCRIEPNESMNCEQSLWKIKAIDGRKKNLTYRDWDMYIYVDVS